MLFHTSHAGFYSSVVPPRGQRCIMKMKKGEKCVEGACGCQGVLLAQQ